VTLELLILNLTAGLVNLTGGLPATICRHYKLIVLNAKKGLKQFLRAKKEPQSRLFITLKLAR